MNRTEKIIDIAIWNKKEHFEHFAAFDDPFSGVTINVDCTHSYREGKGISFLLLILHRIIIAASKIEAFCYRIQTTGLNKQGIYSPNSIHYSNIPWFSFTNMKHPSNICSVDRSPKRFVGKYFKEGEMSMLSISITSHHGLMDGYHVRQFIELLNL